MPVPIEPLIEDGQFDDAPEDLPIEQAPDPRTGFNHIDEPEAVLDWSDELSEEDEDDLEAVEENPYADIRLERT